MKKIKMFVFKILIIILIYYYFILQDINSVKRPVMKDLVFVEFINFAAVILNLMKKNLLKFFK
jgi:Na+/H+-dicarboxylate symporter